MENSLQNIDIEYATFPEKANKFVINSSLTYRKSLSYKIENISNVLVYRKIEEKTDSKATSTIRRIETKQCTQIIFRTIIIQKQHPL